MSTDWMKKTTDWMKKIATLIFCALLVSCGIAVSEEDDLTLTSKFKSTWNIYESIVHNGDGTITYNALPWGGLVGSFQEHSLPVDWSDYESITFEFAAPTEVPTQLMVSDNLKTWCKAGANLLTCYFDGQNVKAINEVALQASDTTTITVKRIYLTPGHAVWESVPIWTGERSMGNWEDGFVIKPDNFTTAHEGDKLEIIFTTDRSDSNVSFWQLKTIYNGTDSTLEGNSNELNDWGCATVGKESTSYRIVLTAKDVKMLKQYGAFVNGYYTNVTQCNLLKKGLVQSY